MQLLTLAPPRERRNDHQSAGTCQMDRTSARETARVRTVVCVGDSNVCGQVSVSFVDLLRQRLSDDGFHFINAGINGDLAHNVLLRLDAVVARQPDSVVILVGSNDVNATLDPGVSSVEEAPSKSLDGMVSQQHGPNCEASQGEDLSQDCHHLASSPRRRPGVTAQ